MVSFNIQFQNLATQYEDTESSIDTLDQLFVIRIDNSSQHTLQLLLALGYSWRVVVVIIEMDVSYFAVRSSPTSTWTPPSGDSYWLTLEIRISRIGKLVRNLSREKSRSDVFFHLESRTWSHDHLQMILRWLHTWSQILHIWKSVEKISCDELGWNICWLWK